MAEEKREGPLKIGQIFMSKYEIVSLIGQGGHAFVYEARHRFMRHVVALKILHRDGGVSDDMLRRGQVEAQVQKRIRHANIVQVDDADITDDRQLYIVMERLRGRSWRDALLDVGRFSVDEVLVLAAQAADGLHAAHGHGVIHRDVKPDNVFLTRDNGVKLLDFGIAKVADVAAWATQKDMVLGTIYYMSPEQVLAKPLTPRTDMYSLGVMMIEALLGEHPVPRLLGRNEPSLYSFTRIIATESLRPLDELDPRIPRYVADLIATLTAKKANDRLGTMGDVAAACRECRASAL
jgi:serine/threonine-protein kinase